jgi:intein-encoded DNA endonuclease-like protein
MLIDIKKMRKVRLKPNDIVVLYLNTTPTQDQVKYLKDGAERIFKDHNVYIIGPGEKMEVVSPEEAPK